MGLRPAVPVLVLAMVCIAAARAAGTEYHVSVKGDDANDGSVARPLKSIMAGARLAQPGDVLTVHEGVYREQVTPPRGGESDTSRIVYRAAPGERVDIRGSEVVKGWEKVEQDTWKVVLPNAFFGGYNPFGDLIRGDWFDPRGREHHTGAVYLNGHWLAEAAKPEDVTRPAGETPLWFAEVDAEKTTIRAQFKDVNPNEAEVEVNVRRAVFYPAKPGVNFITVRGFALKHAATQWAPPTAEQIGLIGTHWSKGWIIEDNDISYSACTGVTLGKYGDQWDNTSANTAEGYVETIKRALANGWNEETVGGHVVRNNTISHCEQAGIVGSMGAIFSTVTGNTIHDINVRQLFVGAEMAGIKFHGAIDTLISNNHIYRCVMGIWLDWMAQGAHVSRNLIHDSQQQDLFVEVNHGPFLVDSNLFLSPTSIVSVSQGGAYAHNLFAGDIHMGPDERMTPYHKAHSTELAGMHNNPVGDDRFYNNLFVGTRGLKGYDEGAFPAFMTGNVYLKGAEPSKYAEAPLVLSEYDPQIALAARPDGFYLQGKLDPAWAAAQTRPIVNTELLGKTHIAGLPYENPDGSPLRITDDYFGKPRNADNPFPGPFATPEDGKPTKVWPVDSSQ